MQKALQFHWPEYLMEAAALAIFMVSASVFTMLLYYPASPLVKGLPAEFPRRVLVAMTMGLTAIAIIYSPWGKQSGAHMNPAVTLTFYRLGKIAPWDALFYIIAQFVGGLAGVAVVAVTAGKFLADPAVNYVATIPGPLGPGVAFLGEVIISFILMFVILAVSNTPKLAPFTGICAGICIVLFISFEAPLSGMSMNPARTLGSALLPHEWNSIWIYFMAPPLGMLLAAAACRQLRQAVTCAKLHHHNHKHCIFCEFHALQKNNRKIARVASRGRLT